MKKRLLALLIATVMLFSVVPMNAFAAPGPEENVISEITFNISLPPEAGDSVSVSMQNHYNGQGEILYSMNEPDNTPAVTFDCEGSMYVGYFNAYVVKGDDTYNAPCAVDGYTYFTGTFADGEDYCIAMNVHLDAEYNTENYTFADDMSYTIEGVDATVVELSSNNSSTDFTVYATVKAEPVYSLRFVTNIEAMNDPDVYFVESYYGASQPTEVTEYSPEQDGYTFTGWYSDLDCTIPFEFGNCLTGNTDVFAGWEEEGEATVSWISFSQWPQVDYYENDAVNLDGATINVGYSDGSSETIPLTEEMLSGFTTETCGPHLVRYTYGGITEQFYIYVRHEFCPNGNGIKCSRCGTERDEDDDWSYIAWMDIEEEPKTSYIEGETLDTTGGTVRLIYDNGQTADVISFTPDMVEGFPEQAVAGGYFLWVNYETVPGYRVNTSYAISIKHNFEREGNNYKCTFCQEEIPAIDSIDLLSAPSRVYYAEDMVFAGKPVDFSGCSFRINYADGTSAEMNCDATIDYYRTYEGVDYPAYGSVNGEYVSCSQDSEGSFFFDWADNGNSGYDIYVNTLGQRFFLCTVTYVPSDVVSVSVENLIPRYSSLEGNTVTVTHLDSTTQQYAVTSDMLLDVRYSYYSDYSNTNTRNLLPDEIYGQLVKLGDNYAIYNYSTGILSFMGAECEAYSKNVEYMYLNKMPKTEYFEKEPLDVTDGSLYVRYDDGTSEEVPLTENMISGFSTETAGKREVTVTYKDQTDTYQIYVKHNWVEDGSGVRCTLCGEVREDGATWSYVNWIETDQKPKQVYFENERIDITGGTILLHYDDDSVSDPVPMTANMIREFNTENVGQGEVYILYQGCGCYYEISVRHNWKENGTGVKCDACGLERENNATWSYVSGLEFATEPKTTYFENEQLDVAGATLRVYFDGISRYDGTSEIVSLTKEMVTKFSTASEGVSYLYVEYLGYTIGRQITVNHRFERSDNVNRCTECGFEMPIAERFELIKAPTRTYYKNDSFFDNPYDLSGCIVDVYFADGTVKRIDCDRDLLHTFSQNYGENYPNETIYAVFGIIGGAENERAVNSKFNPDFFMFDWEETADGVFELYLTVLDYRAKICTISYVDSSVKDIKLVGEGLDGEIKTFDGFSLYEINDRDFMYYYTRRNMPEGSETLVKLDNYIEYEGGYAANFIEYYDATAFETEAMKHFDTTSEKMRKNVKTTYDVGVWSLQIFFDAERNAYGWFHPAGGMGDGGPGIQHSGYIDKGNNQYDIYYEWYDETIRVLRIEYTKDNIRFLSFETVDEFPGEDSGIVMYLTREEYVKRLTGSTFVVTYEDGTTEEIPITENTMATATVLFDRGARYWSDYDEIYRDTVCTVIKVGNDYAVISLPYDCDVDSNGTISFMGITKSIISMAPYESLIEVKDNSDLVIEALPDVDLGNGSDGKPIMAAINGIGKETTVDDFLKNFEDSNPDAELSVIDKDGKEITEDKKVGTGSILRLIVADEIVEEVVLIVTGDNSGDGVIDVVDVKLSLNASLGKQALTGVFNLASNVNDDDTIDVVDVKLILNVSLGKKSDFSK